MKKQINLKSFSISLVLLSLFFLNSGVSYKAPKSSTGGSSTTRRGCKKLLGRNRRSTNSQTEERLLTEEESSTWNSTESVSGEGLASASVAGEGLLRAPVEPAPAPAVAEERPSESVLPEAQLEVPAAAGDLAPETPETPVASTASEVVVGEVLGEVVAGDQVTERGCGCIKRCFGCVRRSTNSPQATIVIASGAAPAATASPSARLDQLA